jgi:hypothetical protein
MAERAEGETFVVLEKNEGCALASGPKSKTWDASVFWPSNRGKAVAAELKHGQVHLCRRTYVNPRLASPLIRLAGALRDHKKQQASSQGLPCRRRSRCRLHRRTHPKLSQLPLCNLRRQAR